MYDFGPNNKYIYFIGPATTTFSWYNENKSKLKFYAEELLPDHDINKFENKQKSLSQHQWNAKKVINYSIRIAVKNNNF